MGQKLVKKLSKICQIFCSKFKTSGEDDDDDVMMMMMMMMKMKMMMMKKKIGGS
jgi:hypothetical protein